MPRHYMDEGTAASNASSSDQVHYLHNGTIRSKLIVLKPESTFTTESDRRHHSHSTSEEHNGSSQHHHEKKGSYSSSEPGSHIRLSLLDSRRLKSRRFIPTRQRCTRKVCVCMVVAVVSVVFGAAVGVYFGFRILESETTKVKEFRGAFRVVGGDNYTEELVDVFSDAFLTKSRLYKSKLDSIFSNSVLKKAYLGSEVLTIDPGESDTGDDIVVRFNIRMDPSKIDVDAGDVYLILVNKIKGQSQHMNGLHVDEDSIEVHERKSKFIPNKTAPLSVMPVTKTMTDGTRPVPFANNKAQMDLPMDNNIPRRNRIMSHPPAREHGVGADSNILEAILSGASLMSAGGVQNTNNRRQKIAHDGSQNSGGSPRRPAIQGSRQNPKGVFLQPTTENSFMVMNVHGNKKPGQRPGNGGVRTVGGHSSLGAMGSSKQDTRASLPRGEQDIDQQSANVVIDDDELNDNFQGPYIGHGSIVVKTTSHSAHAGPGPFRDVDAPNVAPPPRIVAIGNMRAVSSKRPPNARLTRYPDAPPRSIMKLNTGDKFAMPSKSNVPRTRSPQVASSNSNSQSDTNRRTAMTTRTRGDGMASPTKTSIPAASSTTEVRTTNGSPTAISTPPLPLASKLLSFLPLLAQNRQCVPPELNLCSTLTRNFSSIPSLSTVMAASEVGQVFDFVKNVLESGCYEYAHYFVCQLLQPGCDSGKPVLPCRSFCENFLDKCRHLLPGDLYRSLTCEILPSDETTTCVGTPECIHDLRTKGRNDLVCDGIVDCYDMSDETRCGWCTPGQFVCGGQTCVDIHSRCDGKADCPNKADERNCLALASSTKEAAHAHPYTDQGYVFLNDRGAMGKICADTLLRTIPKARREVVLKNVGESACELLHYKHLLTVDTKEDADEVGPYFHILNPLSWKVTFLEAPCQTKQVVHVGCSGFICGKRPSRTPEHKMQLLDGNKRVALADHGDWPWHAALYNDGNHACDGTLISDQWILTSNTCFQGLPDTRWVARIGTVRLDSSAPFQQRRRVIGRAHSPVKGSDVVLIKLESPILLTDFVRPACLPKTDRQFPTGKRCITLGWDLSRNQLRQVTVVLTETEECLWRWPVGKLHVFCTSEPSGVLNDCQGEDQSGSPLLCDDDDGTWFVTGVVNWRIGCGLAKQPRLYDSVAVNTNWILTTIRNHELITDISHEIVDM